MTVRACSRSALRGRVRRWSVAEESNAQNDVAHAQQESEPVLEGDRGLEQLRPGDPDGPAAKDAESPPPPLEKRISHLPADKDQPDAEQEFGEQPEDLSHVGRDIVKYEHVGN